MDEHQRRVFRAAMSGFSFDITIDLDDIMGSAAAIAQELFTGGHDGQTSTDMHDSIKKEKEKKRRRLEEIYETANRRIEEERRRYEIEQEMMEDLMFPEDDDLIFPEDDEL